MKNMIDIEDTWTSKVNDISIDITNSVWGLEQECEIVQDIVAKYYERTRAVTDKCHALEREMKNQVKEIEEGVKTITESPFSAEYKLHESLNLIKFMQLLIHQEEE